ncbi:Magnesium transporter NIPA2 [Fasciola hepatica]|uniref:Magnesium transporter NIPA2 n=1 Tax=Fasciola hepatica TaxID=6192 RepID=A0A4E0RZP0_FASHE|nr:Magnesium transporter NIPA2 [Fasciola hepatica]
MVSETDPDSSLSFYAGLCLAVLSTLMIGSGFIFKKRALLRAANRGIRAGDGGLIYLRDWMWWAGLSLFALGEGANFVAYALAPAVLVTPLGGLSVLVCAVLSYQFLGERLNLAGKLGCLICLLGSTLVMLHAPKEQVVDTLNEMRVIFFDRAFIIYGAFVLLLASLLIFVLGPRFGKTTPLIYILISASLGSLSVMACKGLGIGIKEAILKDFARTLTSWFFWMLIVLLIAGISIQLYYLNRALDLFNTGLVTALLYVFFTGFVLTASAILFREWVTLEVMDYVELSLAFVLITVGVFMMTVLKDVDLNWKTLAAARSASNSPGLLRGDELNPNDTRGRYKRYKPKQSPSIRKSPDSQHLLPLTESWSSDSSELDLAGPPNPTAHPVALEPGTTDSVLTNPTVDRGVGMNSFSFNLTLPNSKDV